MFTCKKQLTVGAIGLLLLAACAGMAPAAPIETALPVAESPEPAPGKIQFVEFYSPL